MCVLLQLSKELSFIGVYPGTGGVSEYCSKNLPSPALKPSSDVMLPTELPTDHKALALYVQYSGGGGGAVNILDIDFSNSLRQMSRNQNVKNVQNVQLFLTALYHVIKPDDGHCS